MHEDFLSPVWLLQREPSQATILPFQYIVTTTTPPPADLQSDAVCLVLDPSSDERLLFGRRFVGAQQAALR